MIVVDTSAIVAFLRGEPGQDAVAARLTDACMSAVSVAELMARMAKDGLSPASTMAHLRDVALDIVPFDGDQIEIAGTLIGLGRRHGIGLGDCCCIALARVRGCPVLTADRAWTKLGIKVDIQLIR